MCYSVEKPRRELKSGFRGEKRLIVTNVTQWWTEQILKPRKESSKVEMAKKTPSFDVLKVTFLHVLSLLMKTLFSYLIICKGEFSSFWILQQWSRPENLLDTEDLLINKPVLEQMDFFPSFSAFYRFAMNFPCGIGRRTNLQVGIELPLL